MRILLCVNHDLMANLALNYLSPALRDHTFDIVLSDGVGKSAPKAPEIVRWGELEQALMADQLFPYLDRRDPHDGCFRSFAGLATASESRVVQRFASLNKNEGLAYVRTFAPDVIVSMRFGQIFGQPVIGIPPHGVLNLHSGFLPSYRGVLATFWAMLRGDLEAGCTLHYIADSSIDTGNVIGVHAVPIDRARSVLWNVAALYEGGTALVAAALDRLATGHAPVAIEQNAGEGAYFSYPRANDMQAFAATGGCLYTERDYVELLAKYDVPHELAAEMLQSVNSSEIERS